MSKDRDKVKYGKFFLDKVSESFRGSKTKDKAKGHSFDSCSTNSSSSGFTGSEIKESDFSPVSQPPIDFNDLPTPDLLSMFEKLLDDMNLNETQKEPLRNSSLENKKLLLLQNDRKDVVRNKKVPYDSPSDYIKLLSNVDESLEKLNEHLTSLRVSLGSKSLGWIQAFGQRGLVLLVNKLDFLTEEIQTQCDPIFLTQLRHAQHECIKGFRAFMNNKIGLLEVFENENALISLVQSLSFRNIPAMIDTVKLLAAVSLCNADKNGHSRVLEAFTIVGEMKQQFRFSIIVAGVSEFDNNPLQDACMQLINALITQPDELDVRLHLRNEIIRTGLVWELIEQIEETNQEDLKRQIRIFIEHKDNDADEFYQRFENIRTELDTLNSCSELLTQKIRDTSCETYLLSIFQHLLLIRDDYSVRTAYYKLIEEVVSQIVLFKNGVDPDFRAHKRFQIDVEDTIEKILEKTKDFDSTLDSREPSEGIKKKLESAVVAKQESDAKLSQYYAKIQEYSKETGLLRNQIKSLGAEISVPETKPLPAPTTSSASKAPPAPPLPPSLGAIPRPPPPPPFGTAPPAPPPPPFLGAGPPPPPPPLPGGLSLGGPRAPPPPPSLGLPMAPKLPSLLAPAEPPLPGFLTVKKYCSTLNKNNKKLKKLNWKTINPQQLTEESFWAKTREQEIMDENLLTDLEEKFSTKNSTQLFNGASKDSSPSDADVESCCSSSSGTGTIIGVRRPKKKKDLKVLDSKAGQALAILQASLKMSHDEFRNALLEIDDSKLYESTLQQLILALPSDDLMKQLISFSDKQDELAEAESFLVKICSIQKLRSRLQSICFKLKFDEMINDVKPEIVAATEACDEVKNSRGFRKVLEIVLFLGNYMNALSAAKNSTPVYAFDINILTKLNDTKSQDNRTTLMHFIADIAEEKATNFSGDFIHVAQAARFSSEIVKKQLNLINQSIKKLEIDLKDYKKQCSNDFFVEKMTPFLESSKSRFNLVESMYKNLTSKYASLAKFFAFDSKKCQIDEFFSDLRTFKDQFEQARADNRKYLENEEKLRRAQEMREKAEKEKLERLEQKRKIMEMSSGGNQEGVMDNLMEALRSGQAFPQRSRTPGKRIPTQQKREAYSRRRSRGAD